jgi:hypothetical protein
MRFSTHTAAVLITVILALALIFYVFSGGSSRREPERAARSTFDPTASCSSQAATELLKGELFRRALAQRRRDQAEVAQVARYSVVRMTSAVATKHDEGSGTITCAGSLALDLPPGIAVQGGQASLTGDIDYGLQVGRDGKTRLTSLGDTAAIVTPLAALGRVGEEGGELMALAGADEDLAAAEPAPAEEATATTAPPPPAVPKRAEAPKREAPRAAPTPAPKRQAANQTPARRAPPAAAPTPPAPRVVATARPSFNCRYARTRGEIAVCNDAGLASLDRQMASQFYSALARARPGQRAMLQRTRNKFLAYRDRCGSTACMAEAYQGRMREIADIMASGY